MKATDFLKKADDEFGGFSVQVERDGGQWDDVGEKHPTLADAEEEVAWFLSGAGENDPRDADNWANGVYRIVDTDGNEYYIPE